MTARPSARASASRSSARALDRCSTCTRAPLSRAPSTTRRDRPRSRPGRAATAGSRRTPGSAGAGPRPARRGPRRARSSARRGRRRCGQGRAEAAPGRAAGTRRRREGDRKHLKPKTPASHSGSRSARLPGTAPPQKPTSTAQLAVGGRRLARRPATVVVGGIGVERHVDQRRDAAERGGPGGGGEALPLGAAGLVHVHVGVDHAGHARTTCRADAQHLARHVVVDRRHRRTLPSASSSVAGANVVVDQHAAATTASRSHQQNPVTDAHAAGAGGWPSRVRLASISP